MIFYNLKKINFIYLLEEEEEEEGKGDLANDDLADDSSDDSDDSDEIEPESDLDTDDLDPGTDDPDADTGLSFISILPIFALPETLKLAKVPVLVMFGCALVVTVPAVVAAPLNAPVNVVALTLPALILPVTAKLVNVPTDVILP